MKRIGFKKLWGIPVFTSIMGLTFYGWHPTSLAQPAVNDPGDSSIAYPILGTTRTGRPADRPYKGGANIKQDIHIQKLDVETKWSVLDPNPFLFRITLTDIDQNSDRPVTVKMRPMLPNGGLGNGYAWTVIVRSGQRTGTFSAKAIDTPTRAIGEPLPLGSYLLEAYQQTDPPSLPHAFGILEVNKELPPDSLTKLAPHSRAKDDGIKRDIRTASHVFTPITQAQVDYPSSVSSITSGAPFNYDIIAPFPPMPNTVDNNNPVLVDVIIQQFQNGGSLKTVRTITSISAVSMQMLNGLPVTTTFSTNAVDDKNVPLPAGNYQMKATRRDNNTPDPASAIAPLTITAPPTPMPAPPSIKP